MKGTVVLTAALSFAASVFAQAPSSEVNTEDVEKYWLLFWGVKHAEQDPGGSVAFLRQSGMSQRGAEDFAKFALQALEDDYIADKRRLEKMCQQREALKASRHAFADALQRNQDEAEKTKRGLVANLGLVLDHDDELKLRTWTLNTARPVALRRPDLFHLIRSGQTNHARGVEKACPANAALEKERAS
jgi:hypothetical protein